MHPRQKAKLTSLANKLFDVDCERQNLQHKLQVLEDQHFELELAVNNTYPVYEDQVIDLDCMALVTRRDGSVQAFTQDQLEKTAWALPRSEKDEDPNFETY